LSRKENPGILAASSGSDGLIVRVFFGSQPFAQSQSSRLINIQYIFITKFRELRDAYKNMFNSSSWREYLDVFQLIKSAVRRISDRYLVGTRTSAELNDKLLCNGGHFNNHNQTNTDYGIGLVTRYDLRKYYCEEKISLFCKKLSADSKCA
jgi:hypothetical protein